MDAKDLRIGNWVYSPESKMNVQVDAYGILTFERSPEKFEPIELTEEIILKIGFLKDEKKYNPPILNTVCYWNNGMKLSPVAGIKRFIYKPNEYIGIVRLDYVHQLQNLYFSLTGEELNTSKLFQK